MAHGKRHLHAEMKFSYFLHVCRTQVRDVREVHMLNSKIMHSSPVAYLLGSLLVWITT